MGNGYGHYRVAKRDPQILRLERRSELPLLVAALGCILLVVVWFFRPWQSTGGLIVSLAMLALLLPGLATLLCRQPWKEVLVVDKAGGHFTREERYLLRRTKVLRLPLETIVAISPEQRVARFWDKRGQMVEHAHWATVLRSSTGQEIELDAANSSGQMRELAEMINGFMAGSRQPPHKRAS